jgi:hypothetical protein
LFPVLIIHVSCSITLPLIWEENGWAYKLNNTLGKKPQILPRGWSYKHYQKILQ